MKKRYTILALSLIGLQTAQISVGEFTSQRNIGQQIMTTVSVKADTISDNQVDTQKIQEFISNPTQVINLNTMDAEERKEFNLLAENEAIKANLPTPEDTEAYKTALISLYDPNSSNYHNIADATQQVIDDINKNHEDILDNISGEKVLAASHGTISVKMLGSALNLGLSFAVGGAAGDGIKALIIKYGAQRARNTIAKVLLQHWQHLE
ncbi:MAG: hypothetical protein LBI43_00375 [Streptococcaceae bacterium]|jgi:hypothetical protein|nr:hypothetical protein [Streptococcaceae bacterium]